MSGNTSHNVRDNSAKRADRSQVDPGVPRLPAIIDTLKAAASCMQRVGSAIFTAVWVILALAMATPAAVSNTVRIVGRVASFAGSAAYATVTFCMEFVRSVSAVITAIPLTFGDIKARILATLNHIDFFHVIRFIALGWLADMGFRTLNLATRGLFPMPQTLFESFDNANLILILIDPEDTITLMMNILSGVWTRTGQQRLIICLSVRAVVTVTAMRCAQIPLDQSHATSQVAAQGQAAMGDAQIPLDQPHATSQVAAQGQDNGRVIPPRPLPETSTRLSVSPQSCLIIIEDSSLPETCSNSPVSIDIAEDAGVGGKRGEREEEETSRTSKRARSQNKHKVCRAREEEAVGEGAKRHKATPDQH